MAVFDSYSSRSGEIFFNEIYKASRTGGKFAVAGQQIAGASENFVLKY
jgi:hypothetical protein